MCTCYDIVAYTWSFQYSIIYKIIPKIIPKIHHLHVLIDKAKKTLMNGDVFVNIEGIFSLYINNLFWEEPNIACDNT